MSELIPPLPSAAVGTGCAGQPPVAHPARDCTAAQRRVLEQIAIGEARGHNRRVLNALAAKGLIQFRDVVLSGVRPMVIVKEPYVPVGVHMQFCEWATTQVPEKDDA